VVFVSALGKRVWTARQDVDLDRTREAAEKLLDGRLSERICDVRLFTVDGATRALVSVTFSRAFCGTVYRMSLNPPAFVQTLERG
jgi:hypothetical protein